jgi:hypothetical protein
MQDIIDLTEEEEEEEEADEEEAELAFRLRQAEIRRSRTTARARHARDEAFLERLASSSPTQGPFTPPLRPSTTPVPSPYSRDQRVPRDPQDVSAHTRSGGAPHSGSTDPILPRGTEPYSFPRVTQTDRDLHANASFTVAQQDAHLRQSDNAQDQRNSLLRPSTEPRIKRSEPDGWSASYHRVLYNNLRASGTSDAGIPYPRDEGFRVFESTLRTPGDPPLTFARNRGLYHMDAIVTGQPIANFIGDIISTVQANRLGSDRNEYLVYLDEYNVLDCFHYATANPPRCVASMSNDPTGAWSTVRQRTLHLSDSNAAVDVIEVEGERTVAVLYALVDIPPATEIVHSYGDLYWATAEDTTDGTARGL